MKTCLVLEGGAMRGMYTAGVLDVFYRAGIHFDGIIGVSAGAAFGVNYLSRQPGRVIRYNKRFNADHHYMGLIPLLKTGNIVDTKYAYEKVPQELDPFDGDTFDASGVPFWVVVTNLETGKPEYIRLEHSMAQMDAIYTPVNYVEGDDYYALMQNRLEAALEAYDRLDELNK